MAEFTKNYFLSPRTDRTAQQPRSPSNKSTTGNKKLICLYLSNVIKSKVNKELSFALGKIMMQGVPKFPFKKPQLFDNDNESCFYSTQVSSPNVTPMSTPKNADQANPVNPFLTTNRLLKKRSSLNETRPISSSKN